MVFQVTDLYAIEQRGYCSKLEDASTHVLDDCRTTMNYVCASISPQVKEILSFTVQLINLKMHRKSLPVLHESLKKYKFYLSIKVPSDANIQR